MSTKAKKNQIFDRAFFVEQGRIGGKKKTPAKLRAARRNMKKARAVIEQLNKGKAK